MCLQTFLTLKSWGHLCFDYFRLIVIQLIDSFRLKKILQIFCEDNRNQHEYTRSQVSRHLYNSCYWKESAK